MANNNQRSNPIYQIGLYRVLSKDECECIPCTAVSEEPKILKTPKYTTQSLLSHLALHPTFKAKYEALVKDPTPKITKFVTGPVGSLTALDRRVIHYIACTHQPFNVVNHETFRTLFAAVIRQGSETMKGEKHYRELVLPRV
ncbi:hypothetical protein AAVH_28149 [Aphelenchoides avenae]|nr:hypothetical protein AAVH_28149 [Aphelenchus avenae]